MDELFVLKKAKGFDYEEEFNDALDTLNDICGWCNGILSYCPIAKECHCKNTRDAWKKYIMKGMKEDGYKPTQEEMSKAMIDLKELVEKEENKR